MLDPSTLDATAQAYIAAWNEPDPERRKHLLEHLCHPTVSYVDDLAQGQGLEQINAIIGTVHTRFPSLRFALSCRPGRYEDCCRFSWTLGDPGAPAMFSGSDYAVVRSGKLLRVLGIWENIPA